ncbi:UNVERIFIED_ORG: dynein-related subfamily AAA family protein [Anoxybacillus amylolyticus]
MYLTVECLCDESRMKIGDILRIEKDNAFTLQDDGNPIGVVVRGLIKEEAYVGKEETVLVQIEDVCGPQMFGTHHNVGIAKVLEREQKEEMGDCEMNKVELKIIGSKTAYPNKWAVLEKVKNGERPVVYLFAQEGKVLAEYDGVLCGVVDEAGVDQAALKQLLASKTIYGTVTKRERFDFFVEVELKEEEQKSVLGDLEGSLRRVLQEGWLTEEELKERLEYLDRCGVTQKQKEALFASYVSYPDEVKARIPKKPTTLYQDQHGLVKRVIAYLNLKRNLLFEGDRGVGKNVLIETLAWLYHRPLYEVSLNSGQDNYSLLGGKTIEVDENGKTSVGFAKEVLIEAAEMGGIVVLDEFNTSLAHVMSVMNALLDDRRRIQVPGYGLVEAHPNFVAIATQNRNYQGTFETNEATVDRFVPIVFPKLKDIASLIVQKMPNVSHQTLRYAQVLFEAIQKCVEDGELDEKAMTVRGFLDAVMAIEYMDVSPKEAFMDNVIHRIMDLDERKVAEDILTDMGL